MDTENILGVINRLEGKGVNHNLKVLKKDTNEVFGTSINYVADEILFIFAEKDVNRSCADYNKSIEYESYCEDWNDRAIENISEERDLDINDRDLIDNNELLEEKMNIVIGLDTRVYFGKAGDCPIANYSKSFEIEDILVKDNNVLLVC